MKILHINTGQEGGAAWCARRINNALVQEGVESRMLFAEGSSLPQDIQGAIAKPDPTPVFWYRNALLGKVKHFLMRMPWYYDEEKLQPLLDENNIENLCIHQPFSHFKNISHHPLVEWADIIHLHWVSDFVDYPTFFRKVKKPIVWTLHDMYPAIGVMHFESEHTVRPMALDAVDAKCREIKKKALSHTNNLTCVAISEKMVSIIRNSDILGRFPITLIHNGVNVDIFRPLVASTEYHIKEQFPNSIVIMFSSVDIDDNRKGLHRVIDALEKIVQTQNKKICLMAVGGIGKSKLPQASFPIIYTGLVSNQNELAKLYSSADFFINASYEEAFAQTPLESMACGTPVITTPVSGASDLIRPFNGVICPGYTPDALKAGIEQALATTYDRDAIRAHVVEEYNYSKIAKEYIALYERVMSQE